MNTQWFPLGWEPMIPFLLLAPDARVSPPASVTTEGGLSSRGFFFCHQLGVTPSVRVEEDASYSSNLSMNGANRTNIVSATSFSRSKFPSADENSMDGTAFRLVPATTETKFSMLHLSTFLPFW